MSGDAAYLYLSHKRPSVKPAETKWRTLSQQRIYRQKLLNAIKSTTASASASSSAASSAPSSRAIKEAADSALALAAKGQSRWSRAILSSHRRKRRLCLLAAGKIVRPPARRRPAPPPPPSPCPNKKSGRVQERLRVLSRLVPGARKLPTPTLLEEAADYVAALEMQVKAMRALADLLSATSISSPS